LVDRRNVGDSSCDSGDGTDQRVQSLMFMMMMMMMICVNLAIIFFLVFCSINLLNKISSIHLLVRLHYSKTQDIILHFHFTSIKLKKFQLIPTYVHQESDALS